MLDRSGLAQAKSPSATPQLDMVDTRLTNLITRFSDQASKLKAMNDRWLGQIPPSPIPPGKGDMKAQPQGLVCSIRMSIDMLEALVGVLSNEIERSEQL